MNLVGFSELTNEMRARLPPDFERCAHLVTDARVYSCGEAMERATSKQACRCRACFRFSDEFLGTTFFASGSTALSQIIDH